MGHPKVWGGWEANPKVREFYQKVWEAHPQVCEVSGGSPGGPRFPLGGPVGVGRPTQRFRRGREGHPKVRGGQEAHPEVR